MFVDACFNEILTDDKSFRDSFYKECYNIIKNECIGIKWKEKDFEKKNEQFFVVKDEPFWFGFILNVPILSLYYNKSKSLFLVILYRKAEEFGYELKQAFCEGTSTHFIFIKSSER